MTFTITPSPRTINHYTPRHATDAFRMDVLILPLTSLAFVLGLSLAIQRSDDYIQAPDTSNQTYDQEYNIAALPSPTSVAVQYVLVGTFLPGLTFLVSAVHIYVACARALHPGYSLAISLVMFLGWAALACISVMTGLWITWIYVTLSRGVPESTMLFFANQVAICVVAGVWLVRVAVDARAVELMRRAKKAGGRVAVKEESEYEMESRAESRGMVSTSTRPDTSHMSTSAGARTNWSERTLDSEQRSLVGFAGAGAKMGSGYPNEKELPAYGA